MAKDDLTAWLAEARDLLVLHLGEVPTVVSRAVPRRVRPKTLSLADPVPRPREWDTILLAVKDLRALRSAATGLSSHGRGRRVGVLLMRAPAGALLTAPRPEWPPLVRMVATSAGHAFVGLDFADVVPSGSVITEIARLGRRDPSPQWPALGVLRGSPEEWPPGDPLTRVTGTGRLLDHTADFPPDVALVPPEFDAVVSAADHHVLARPPSVVVRPHDPGWSELGPGLDSGPDRGVAMEPLALGPVDERLVNPVGFDKAVTGPVVELRLGEQLAGTVLPDDGRIGEREVAALRRVPGLGLGWRGGAGPVAYCRAVAHLAAAGVPLVSRGPVPDWARALLTAALADALEQEADFSDRLRREETSVGLRRAALRAHALPAWRARVARRQGLRPVEQLTLTVLLPTRRPGMTAFALRQVSRQRGLEGLQLVVLAHGFDPDPEIVEGFRSAAPHVELDVVVAPADTVFGDLLNLGVSRAAGDVVVKMDDDDWYGPDFLADLVLARQYAGADLVGCSSEFTYLAPLQLTTRRADPSEVYAPWVAGGTILIERGLLRAVGGFRSTRRYVDAALLDAVRASGAVIYRGHGLGYVLRREGQGHTWDPGMEYFVNSGSRAAEQWPGFRPSLVLRPDPADEPSTAAVASS